MSAERAAPAAGNAGRDWASISGAQLVGIALGAVAVVLNTRLLGPDGFGTLAIANAALQLLYVCGIHWTMAAAVRFVSPVPATQRRRVLATWLCLPAAALAAAAALVAGLAHSPWWPAGMPATLLVLLLAALTAARLTEHLLQAVDEMRLYAGLRALSRAAYVAALAVALGGGVTLQPWSVLALMGAAMGLQALVALPRLTRAFPGEGSVDAALAAGMLAYSAPLLLRSVGAYALEWVDVYALRYWRTAAEVGVYHLAYQGMLIGSELLAAVTTVAFPLLTGWRARGGEGARAYASEVVPRIAAAWAAVTLCGGLAAVLLVPVLFGSAFRDSGRLCAILLAGAAFQGLAYLYLPVFGAYDSWGRATAILFLMGGVNLVVDVLLVPAWGGLGAAAGTIAGCAVGAVLYVAAGNRLVAQAGLAPMVPPLIAAAALPAIVYGGLGLHALAAVLAVAAIAVWARHRGLLQGLDSAVAEALGLRVAR